LSPPDILAAVGKDPTLTGRTHLWERAVDFIHQNTVLGVDTARSGELASHAIDYGIMAAYRLGADLISIMNIWRSGSSWASWV